ncbi:hypothetical protein M1C59_25725 (plasmid) [Gordonia terrae]|nr:hypothetical protein [Gordonia terrae]UPW11959.1 hypothetical protein M1C59_25725 [Gordonia terrae]
MCAVIGAVTGALVAAAAPSQYKSTVQMVVGTCGEGSVDQAYACSMFADNRSSTYLSLLNGPTLAAAVIDDLGLGVTAADLAGRITVSAEQQSALFDITVTDADAATAVKIAESAATQAGRLVIEVDRPGSDPQPLIGVNRVGEPSVPTRDGRSPAAVGVVGLLAGFLVGVIAAVIRSRTAPELSSQEDLEEITDLPILAAPASNPARVGRQLRAALVPRLPGGQPSVVVVTGVGDEGSSSAVATSLARSFVDGANRVVLIDANSDSSAADSGYDLATLLRDADGVKDLAAIEPFLRVGSGHVSPDHPYASPPSVHSLVQRLRDQFDYIVIDSRDADTNDMTETFAADADITVLTVLRGTTRVTDLGTALARLPRIGASVGGLVFATEHLS